MGIKKTYSKEEFLKLFDVRFYDFLKYISYNNLTSEIIICGSVGLKLNGLLERQSKDIDILTLRDDYRNEIGYFDIIYRTHSVLSSHRFMIGKDEIKCHKINLFNLNIDVLYSPSTINYDLFEIDGLIFKVEKPERALQVKKLYIEHNSEEYKQKHINDIDNLDLPF